LNHFATRNFWAAYRALPADARELADKNFALLMRDPQHPSLHFKAVGNFRSVRVGLRYRALGVEISDGVSWFWIGTHSEYDRLVS
jgi:hypothetical protein